MGPLVSFLLKNGKEKQKKSFVSKEIKVIVILCNMSSKKQKRSSETKEALK